MTILDAGCSPRRAHRLEKLRPRNDALLPGHVLLRPDSERRLVSDVFPWVDGRAEQRSLLPQVLPTTAQSAVADPAALRNGGLTPRGGGGVPAPQVGRRRVAAASDVRSRRLNAPQGPAQPRRCFGR